MARVRPSLALPPGRIQARSYDDGGHPGQERAKRRMWLEAHSQSMPLRRCLPNSAVAVRIADDVELRSLAFERSGEGIIYLSAHRDNHRRIGTVSDANGEAVASGQITSAGPQPRTDSDSPKGRIRLVTNLPCR